MSYMGQSRDYYEDNCKCTALIPCCQRNCCEYVRPSCCSSCCCEELPCIIREDRTVYRRLTPVCAPGRVKVKRPPRCCPPTCDRCCPPCARPCCDCSCAPCCNGPCVTCPCAEGDNGNEKNDAIGNLMLVIVMLVIFAIISISVYQQIAASPCRRRRFF